MATSAAVNPVDSITDIDSTTFVYVPDHSVSCFGYAIVTE